MLVDDEYPSSGKVSVMQDMNLSTDSTVDPAIPRIRPHCFTAGLLAKTSLQQRMVYFHRLDKYADKQ